MTRRHKIAECSTVPSPRSFGAPAMVIITEDIKYHSFQTTPVDRSWIRARRPAVFSPPRYKVDVKLISRFHHERSSIHQLVSSQMLQSQNQHQKAHISRNAQTRQHDNHISTRPKLPEMCPVILHLAIKLPVPFRPPIQARKQYPCAVECE